MQVVKMNRKVILYLAIFFATLAFFEVEAAKSKIKLVKKASRTCSKLADEVAEVNQTGYDTLRYLLQLNSFCLGQVQENGTV